MPLIFGWNGYRFHFYSDEGDPREPIHIHVAHPNGDAKFWLYPEITVVYNHGFSAKTMRRLRDIVEEHREIIEEAWNEHFS